MFPTGEQGSGNGEMEKGAVDKLQEKLDAFNLAAQGNHRVFVIINPNNPGKEEVFTVPISDTTKLEELRVGDGRTVLEFTDPYTIEAQASFIERELLSKSVDPGTTN